MAEAALSMAVEKLGSLAIEKVSFLLHVEEQVTRLKDELKNMQRFLKDATEKQFNDERIRGWISDIRNVAHDAEDVIESYVLKVDGPRRRRGLLRRCASFPKHVYHLGRLGQEIESIQKRVKDIGERRLRYGIQSLDEVSVASSDGVERRRRVSPWEQDKHVVGFEEHVDTLQRKAIFIKREGLSTASIVGMGGAGKSTLAKKVYNHAAVGQGFECRAWVTVSRDFSPKALLKKLLLELGIRDAGERTDIENLPEESLEHMVYQRLQGTQYFVVLDDVWRQQDWDCIARAFPNETDKASRLLITSRVHNIPKSAHYVHELKGLDPNQSWQLFLKAAFSETDDDKCPPELENIGRKIVEKCNGLPLAISVMGGLLLEQGQSVSKWERALKGIKTHLEEGEDGVRPILELSYQDLNPNLKSCFLYISFFKEDVDIYAQQLIALWIAEGIVPQERGEERMEEIAKDYLDKLVNRNMVQALEFSEDGQVQLCRVHDLLRDLSIMRSKEEINFDFLSDGDMPTNEYLDKARHITIYCNNEKFMSSWKPNSHLRSLSFSVFPLTAGCIPPRCWKRLGGCLRVLQLGGLGLKIVPKRIGNLVGLRYLCLSGNNIQRLPRSLGYLINLQILDIRANINVIVPNIIWKLESLLHLYLSGSMICEEPLKLDTLKNLQTLYSPTENIVVEHLAELVSLRDLVLWPTTSADVNEFFTFLARLENLVSVSFSWSSGALSLDGIVNLQHLTLLRFYGKLEKSSDGFPNDISYLTLSGTCLNEDPMPVLGKLPHLLHLTLGEAFYVGREIVIAHDGFPRLKVLVLTLLWELRQMYIENTGLLELKHLEISNCPNLEILPEEEEKRIMGNLKKLKILGPGEETEFKLKSYDYSHIISNIPSVEIFSY